MPAETSMTANMKMTAIMDEGSNMSMEAARSSAAIAWGAAEPMQMQEMSPSTLESVTIKEGMGAARKQASTTN